MRRSTAPSQLNKKPLFIPPEKKEFHIAKRQCRPVNDLNLTGPVGESKNSLLKETITPNKTEVRSPNDLLGIIKSCRSKEKENVFSEACVSIDENAERLLMEKKVDNKTTLGGGGSDQGRNPTLQQDQETRYFSVVWCKLSKKKHKKWEGDAILVVKGRTAILKSMEGMKIGQGSGYKLKDLETLEEGNTLPIGAKEIEIQGVIKPENYISGKCFQGADTCEESQTKAGVPPRPKPKPFCLPFKSGFQKPDCRNGKDSAKPLYNVTNAIVFPKPPPHHQWTYNVNSVSIIDVVVDPHVGSHLRFHQQAGVVFLYECVLGFRMKGYNGAILADEMGLGKTLQCITLVWTLLKQGPYGGKPLLKKVLIVTPSSLVLNWGQEFDKWLGKERIKPFIVDQCNKPEDFPRQNISPVLIISYEMLIRRIEAVEKMDFDLMLCDEGHRLKNCQIKTTSLLASLNIKRRVIITGTPIQNDLQELFSLVEFVNPGMLCSSLSFRKVYEEPIVRSRQPEATHDEKQMGESRAEELTRITSRFTLRRTTDIIKKFLPPKTEYVVFCPPATSQADVYDSVVRSRAVKKCFSSTESGDHLSAICILRKLCNHPSLLCTSDPAEQLQQSEMQSEVSHLLPEDISKDVYLEEDSGKLAVLSCLLSSLYADKRERIVLVSNFTTTLDMLQQLCRRYEYPFLRLDGSTPSSKRQSLVDRFNASYCKEFVFLLSAKAGGVGLNLIGASRILLFDIDWNPSTDLQAMARVWRDGQTKHVHIYRLILAGSIEEKMFQRQVCKQSMSSTIIDAKGSSKMSFSLQELQDLFHFYPDVACLTHDLLDCPCDQMGQGNADISLKVELDERDCHLSTEKNPSKFSTSMDQLCKWQHFSVPQATDLLNDFYLESGSDFISFVFKNQIYDASSTD